MMKRFVLVALVAPLMCGSALAGGFALREQSVEGQGASFAGIAAGGPASAMFWNPATMSQHADMGLSSESNVSLVLPYSQAEDGGLAAGVPSPGLNDSGNIGQWAVLPASYWLYGWNEDLTLGVSMNAPYGLVTDSDRWIGSPHGDRSKVTTYTVTPSVAYRVGEMVSVGFGVQGQFMAVDLSSRDPASDVRIFDVEGQDIGIGFTAGVLFEPSDSTSIGIGFRSAVKHNLEGDGFLIPAGFRGDIEADFTSPETVTIGARVKATDQLTLLAGAEWANWSRFEELRIESSASGATIGFTDESWKDSWFISAGAEYAFNDHLTLRGGVAYEKSPVPDATRTPRVPDNDRYWLSLGASYELDHAMKISVAYSHVFMNDGDVALAGGGGLPPLNASFEQDIDIVSVSFARDW